MYKGMRSRERLLPAGSLIRRVTLGSMFVSRGTMAIQLRSYLIFTMLLLSRYSSSLFPLSLSLCLGS